MPGQKATEAARREQILKAAYETALRRGIDGLTVRAVATRARLSHGLVLFHFKRKDQLGLALLDQVIAATVSLSIPEEIRQIPDPRECLRALIRHEMLRLSEEPRRIRLFLEYWARGAHSTMIRERIRAGLNGYRTAFRELAEEAANSTPDRSDGVTPAALAAAAVSLILGFPVQEMIDSGELNLGEYLACLEVFGGRQPRGQGSVSCTPWEFGGNTSAVSPR